MSLKIITVKNMGKEATGDLIKQTEQDLMFEAVKLVQKMALMCSIAERILKSPTDFKNLDRGSATYNKKTDDFVAETNKKNLDSATIALLQTASTHFPILGEIFSKYEEMK